MNLVFSIITILSLILLTIYNPSSVLSALSSGVEKATTLSVKLFSVYALWLGVFELIKSSGIGRLLEKILKKPIKLIFGSVDKKAEECLCMNISSNLLGLGGAATPMGIEAERLLEKSKNAYAQNMLFVVASSSLQLLPITVVGLRGELGSSSPNDVILTTLLSTLVSTVTGILLVKVFCKK